MGWIAGGVVFARRLAATQERVDREWRRRTEERLGLPHEPEDRHRLAILVSEPQAPYGSDCGFLAETEDAIVFLDSNGSITKIPWKSIRITNPAGFCSAWWVGLHLYDGSSRFITLREGGDGAWGRRTATFDLGARVEARIKSHECSIPRWSLLVSPHAELLQGLKIGMLPEQIGRLEGLGRSLAPPGERVTATEAVDAAIALLTFSLSLALADRGWKIDAGMGRGWRASKDSVEIDLEDMIEKFRKGELSAQAWRTTWGGAGLLETDLSDVARRAR